MEVEDGEEFLQEVVYPILPKFCSHCQAIGHSIGECKGLQKESGKEESSVIRNTYQQPWRVKKSKNELGRDEGVANMRTQQKNFEQTIDGDVISSGTKETTISQQVVVRETTTSTIEIQQEGREQVNVLETQEQTQRLDSPIITRNPGKSLALTNSFTALEGELDLDPVTPDPELLVSEAEKLISRWGDDEEEVSPSLEPVGFAVVDPRIDIQYTRRDPGTRPRSGIGGGTNMSSSSGNENNNNLVTVIQEASAIKARLSELEAKRQVKAPTSKVKKKHSDSSAPKTRSDADIT